VNTARVASLVGGIVFAVALVGASPSSAATLIGDYQFQGTVEPSGPGTPLHQINDIGTYASENVMGTSRRVFRFDEGEGLEMQPVGFMSNPPTHSVVTTFRLLNDTGYNRILDWSAGTDDNGIYDHARKVSYYRVLEGVESDGAVLGSNTYSTVAVTSTGTGPSTRVFVNGSAVLSSAHAESNIGDSLRFFVDNSSGGTTGEASAGAVSCIRVFNGILTDAEIAAIGASPDCIAHPKPQSPSPAPTAAPKKKCKKHKKKHRSAESAKKKKCKKKKKR
jgi:hypothetical protein